MIKEEKRNYDVYLEKMEKAMKDKLFFLDHIDINSYDYVIDFGCADGELLSRLDIPDSRKIGVDSSEEMRKRFKEKLPNILLFSNISDLFNFFKDIEEDKKILLILSSVLHETFSTLFRFGILGFSICFANTVVIRDMIEPELLISENIMISTDLINSIYKDSDPEVAYKWELERGEITNLADLSEYLLKMDYVENYDLEIKEHYFWGYVEIYQKLLKDKSLLSPFKTIYEEDFTIPPMIEKQDKYGLPHFRTHKKLIMLRKFR